MGLLWDCEIITFAKDRLQLYYSITQLQLQYKIAKVLRSGVPLSVGKRWEKEIYCNIW